MRNIFVFFGILLVVNSVSAQVDTIPPSDSLIEYTGRIDFSSANAPTFSYSGVSIRACFTGTSISMIMDDDVGQNYYNLILDGKLLDTLRVTQGQKAYKLAEGLETGEHEIEIFKRTELTFGKTSFYGFIVDEGAQLLGLKNERKKFIEYIGNSITCGYGNEGNLGETFGATTENHYLTYAAITSRNFNARHMSVSRSGIGIYRNYNGPLEGNQDCMTNYYTRIFLYDENPKYNFAVQPDLVCINLGTNDFSTTGADSALYVSNYFRLIDTIQNKYTKPEILCLLGPMMSGNTLQKVRGYLEFIADSASKIGKGNVRFFEMSAQTGELGIAIDYHPTVAQNQYNANELTEYISSIMDWKVQPLLISAEILAAKHIKLNFNTELIDPEGSFGGFALQGSQKTIEIDSVSKDDDRKVLHVWLKNALSVAETVNLIYQPGTVHSHDSLDLNAINVDIQNQLTETVLSRAATSLDGNEINLFFNKNIDAVSEIDGIEIMVDGEPSAIESFLINNQQITLYTAVSLVEGNTLTLSYDGQGIIGFDGVVLSPIHDFQVENNVKVTTVNESAVSPLQLYPNPNKAGRISYSIPQSFLVDGPASMEVLSANGITVYIGSIEHAEGTIDLRGKLTQGLYLVKVVISSTIKLQTSLLIV